MVGRRAYLFVIGLALLSACGGGSGPAGPTATPAAPENGVLAVHGSEFKFQPSRVVLRKGQQVRIEFQNDGEILHDFKIDGLDADVAESDSKNELFVSAGPGKGGTLVFTPKKTGAFTFYCTIPRHRQLGMRGYRRIGNTPAHGFGARLGAVLE